jgi:hypothetical protein
MPASGHVWQDVTAHACEGEMMDAVSVYLPCRRGPFFVYRETVSKLQAWTLSLSGESAYLYVEDTDSASSARRRQSALFLGQWRIC